MFNLGMTELLLVLVVALLVLGPKKLPDLARSLGRSMAEFRRASDDFRHGLTALPEERKPPAPPSDRSPEADAEEDGPGSHG